MAQHIGARHDAALDLFAKAFSAGFFVHAHEVGVILGAVAKLHTIKATQVRAGLGGRDDVVHGNGQFSAGQRDGHELGALGFEQFERCVNRSAHVCGQTIAKELLGNAYAQALQAVVQLGREVFNRHVE